MTELRAEERFSPIMFAQQDVVNKISQYWNVIPLIPKMEFPTRMKDIVWIADIRNIIIILELI
jgi:hypothetical protein